MMKFEALLFYGFAAMALAGAFGVLLSRNIVRTAMWLLATLAAAAGLYFLLGATFVGAIQLIVYAGGTLVLIVFGVMLTSKNPHMRFMPRKIEIAAGAIVCLVLAAALVWVLLGTIWPQPTLPTVADKAFAPVEKALLSSETTDRLTDRDADGTSNIGRQLLSTYLVPFEAVSVLLLAVLIGASYLARPRVPFGKTGGSEGPPPQEGGS